jgi:peroxiredoxin
MAVTLENAVTENGISLVDLVEASPVLLVFLRHAGCTFCREALSDIAAARAEIEKSGTRTVLVHMGDGAEMKAMVARYGVGDLERISDPDHALYEAFGLRKGNIWQLYGPKVWLRGLLSGLLFRHGIAFPVADFRQMPGAFYIRQGAIASRFRHRSSSDRVPYARLCGTSGQRSAFGLQ